MGHSCFCLHAFVYVCACVCDFTTWLKGTASALISYCLVQCRSDGQPAEEVNRFHNCTPLSRTSILSKACCLTLALQKQYQAAKWTQLYRNKTRTKPCSQGGSKINFFFATPADSGLHKKVFFFFKVMNSFFSIKFIKLIKRHRQLQKKDTFQINTVLSNYLFIINPCITVFTKI